MIKSGLYAVYGGREYAAAKTGDGVKLIYDGENPPEGFAATPYGNYVKTVAKADVSKLELVKSYAVLEGERFEIASEEGGMITIASSDEKMAERFGMEKADRHDYRKKIRREEADGICESRRTIQ